MLLAAGSCRLRLSRIYLLLVCILVKNGRLQAFSQSMAQNKHAFLFPCRIMRPTRDLHVLRAEKTVQVEDDPDTSSANVAVVSPSIEGSFNENAFVLTIASIIGVSAGLNVAVFKTMIEFLSKLIYGGSTSFDGLFLPPLLQPAVGGFFVGLLVWRYGKFAPGLRGTIREVDSNAIIKAKWDMVDSDDSSGSDATIQKPESYAAELGRASRKTLGSVFTLGAGNSLGPEGPSVELGMAVSRLFSMVKPPEKLFGVCIDNKASAVTRARLFLSCGAAAGVAAGFNAPLAGVFFALEIVQAAFRPLGEVVGSSTTFEPFSTLDSNASIKVSPILLSSVIAALLAKNLLGNELALSVPPFDFQNPLLELPLYLLLGVLSGVVASLFSGAAQQSKAVFDGLLGPQQLRDFFASLPPAVKPFLGSVFCGGVGLFIPETLFFGYDTLNRLLAEEQFSTGDALILLMAKFSTTTIAAASGLVGGTFAPSLFMGGMLGTSYHNVMLYLWTSLQSNINFNPLQFDLSGTPAYALVGGASVLASLFRAPLTATMLLFECTRNYDVILPLMASAGVASLVGDIVETLLEEQKRDQDAVSWGDLAMIGKSDDENK